MNGIERDLIRWNRGKWLAAVGVVFGVQIAVLVWGSRGVESRSVYPAEPQLSFGERQDEGWAADDVENPFLFASASWNGFSGEAWLRKPDWEPPALLRPVRERYLGMEETGDLMRSEAGERNFTLVERRRPRAVFAFPEAPPRADGRKSELKLEGFANRPLVAGIALPEQFHSDVLEDSVVEVLLGRDGLVISARVIENSGSPKADADALGLAKEARFAPVKNGEESPVIGKLIFSWFALNLGDTNNVKR